MNKNIKKWSLTHLLIDGEDYKKCSICNQYKLATTASFYKNSSNSVDGLNPYCILCTKEKSLKRIYDNYDDFKKYMSAYNKKASVLEQKIPRERRYRKSETHKLWKMNNSARLAIQRKNRDLHKTHKISKKEWEFCKEYFDNECAYCGLNFNDHYIMRKGILIKTDLHKDHVDHSGNNLIDNCVPACRDCNSSKHDRELEVWYNGNNKRYNVSRLLRIYHWIGKDYKTYIKFK